jgi:hypothetical protein
VAKSIFKYPLAVDDLQMLDIPEGAEPLTVQIQHDRPCLWALVDPEKPTERRAFRTYGTGHPVDTHPGAYVGTYQLDGGALVFHVFDVFEPNQGD